MGKDKRRIQQTRAKKKERRAKKKGDRANGQPFADRIFEGFSKTAIQKAPIQDALVNRTIFEMGLGYVVVSRILGTGEIAMGVFLVDVYCLGVKDAFYTLRSAYEYDADVERIGGEDGFDRVTPSHARKLVEGAVAYAKDFGIEPHSDYRKAAVVLGDIDPEECHATFSYGKDGKPFYISGPHHSPQKVKQVMANLRSRCGDDGFHYMLGIDGPDDV